MLRLGTKVHSVVIITKFSTFLSMLYFDRHVSIIVRFTNTRSVLHIILKKISLRIKCIYSSGSTNLCLHRKNIMHSSKYQQSLKPCPGANKSCDNFIIFLFILVLGPYFMSINLVFSKTGFIFTGACEVRSCQ